MKPITVLQKHGLNMRSSVIGVYDNGSNYCIALNKDASLRKRGFHLNKEDLLNIFHNLPIELKDDIKRTMRYVQNQEEVEWHNAIKQEPIKEMSPEEANEIMDKVKKAVKQAKEKIIPEPREKLGTEKENDILESFMDGPVASDYAILHEETVDFSQEQLVKHRKELKDLGKELGIKIPPATKNIKKIKARILAYFNEE